MLYFTSYIRRCLLNRELIINNIKIKAMFNSETEVNCMFKRLTNAIQLSIHQNINITMINVTDERARFFDICEIVLISMNNIIISISLFVVKRSNHNLFLKDSFSVLLV